MSLYVGRDKNNGEAKYNSCVFGWRVALTCILRHEPVYIIFQDRLGNFEKTREEKWSTTNKRK